MAYSKTPEQDTHVTRRLPVISGNTFTSSFIGMDVTGGRRYINCYPKRFQQQNTDDQWVVTRTPAIQTEQRTYTGAGGSEFHVVSSDGLYVIIGANIYNADGGASLGTLPGTVLFVEGFFEVTNASGTDKLYAGVYRDTALGQWRSFIFNGTTLAITAGGGIAFLTTLIRGVAYLNSRLYVLNGDGRIYNSGAGAYNTWNSTWFTVPEIRGDDTVTISVYRNHLVAFGKSSIEFFQDGAIEIGSPLTRQEQYTQLYGVAFASNVTKTGDKFFFVSWEDRLGFGIYTFDSFAVKRISDTFIDFLLNANSNPTFPIVSYPEPPTLYIIDLYGDPCLAFLTQESTTMLNCFSTKQGVWFGVQIPNTVTFRYVDSMSVVGSGNVFWKSYCHSGQPTAGVMTFLVFDKDEDNPTAFAAEIIGDVEDLGTMNIKHIKSVALYGDYGSNDVQFYYARTPNIVGFFPCGIKNQNSLGPQNKLKWYNLGPMIYFVPRIQISAGTDFVHKGLEVEYNLGQS